MIRMRRLVPLRNEAVAGLIGGGIVLLLGSAAIRSESAARTLEARASVERELGTVAARIEREVRQKLGDVRAVAGRGTLARGVVAELGDQRYTAWLSDGATLDVVSGTRLSLEPLAPQLSRDEPVVGPLPMPDGRDVVAVYAAVDEAPSETWVGVAIDVDELLVQAGVLDFVRTGMNVHATMADEPYQPIYWSRPVEPPDPVAAELQLPHWRLTAAPVAGWHDFAVDWATALLLGIVAFGYSASYVLLLRRPLAAQSANAALQRRLDGKDEDLAHLLRKNAALESELKASLSLDPHTGLPNRASVVEHVDGRLADRRRGTDRGVLVVAVQFRRLEALSHSLGIGAAAKWLSQAADRLQGAAGDHAFLGRVSDNELAVCAPAAEPSAARDVAERLLGAMEEPLTVDGVGVYAQVAVGVAQSADGYALGADLVDQASVAGDEAVARGERWSLFRTEVHSQRVSLLQLEADLQSAIKNDEFRLKFQPIVDTGTGTVAGFEALLRWQHPRESTIPPDRFIPLAEGMGQMRQISDWVVRQGVAHTKQWLGLREEPAYVSVNLTPRDLSKEFCSQLLRLLDEARVPPEALRVEVTETAVVRDFRAAARLINELNERGVRVLLDDFGTGYSSLSYLRELPFNAVKIDKSFVQRMATEARDFGLVRSIVSLVHYLGMECVAEGIESQEQLDLVAMVDCDYWQGFLFSPPVAASEVPVLLGARRAMAVGGAT